MKPIRAALLLAMLFILAGCATPTESPSDHASNTDAQRQIEQLQAQTTELQRQLELAQTSLSALQAELQRRELPVPHFVYVAQTRYFYEELANGNAYLEMLQPTLQIGFVAEGYPQFESNTPAATYDFTQASTWVRAHPLATMERISLPLSQPGYQRVDLEWPDGWYVTSVWHGHQLTSFLISDKPLGST